MLLLAVSLAVTVVVAVAMAVVPRVLPAQQRRPVILAPPEEPEPEHRAVESRQVLVPLRDSGDLEPPVRPRAVPNRRAVAMTHGLPRERTDGHEHVRTRAGDCSAQIRRERLEEQGHSPAE